MIKEVKCAGCGSYHVVIYRSGRFFFDGAWKKRIDICENCKGDVIEDKPSTFYG